MRVSRTLDAGLVLEILYDDEIFDAISEEEFKREDLPAKVDVINDIWLEVVDDSDDHYIIVGVVQFKQMFKKVWDAHIHILPEFRKEFSQQAGDSILGWCSKGDLNDCLLYTTVPVFCENVKNFLLSFGFKEQGILKNAWSKNGKQNDMRILTKEVS